MTVTNDETEVVATQDPGAGLPGRVTIPRYGTQMGPVGHLAAERRRIAGLEWEHFDATPQSATVGAVIAGVDLRQDLPDDVIAERIDLRRDDAARGRHSYSALGRHSHGLFSPAVTVVTLSASRD